MQNGMSAASADCVKCQRCVKILALNVLCFVENELSAAFRTVFSKSVLVKEDFFL